MSFRGLKKAIYRTPQWWRGSGSELPHELGQLEQAFWSGDRALDQIIQSTRRYCAATISMLDHCIGTYKIFEEEKAVSDLAQVRMLILPQLIGATQRVIQPSANMRQLLQIQVKTVISKRDRKKLDFDRHRIAFGKLQGKQGDRKFDVVARNLELATQEYRIQNELLQTTLPSVLGKLSEFLQAILEQLLHLFEQVMKMLKTHHSLIAAQLRLDSSDADTSPETVLSRWKAQHLEAKHSIEALSLIQMQSQLQAKASTVQKSPGSIADPLVEQSSSPGIRVLNAQSDLLVFPSPPVEPSNLKTTFTKDQVPQSTSRLMHDDPSDFHTSTEFSSSMPCQIPLEIDTATDSTQACLLSSSSEHCACLTCLWSNDMQAKSRLCIEPTRTTHLAPAYEIDSSFHFPST